MRTFTETVRDLRQGSAESDISRDLADLVQAIRETGRAGSITVTLSLKPVTAGDGTQLIVEDKVTVKKPMPQRGSTVLFATEDNELSRRDARQPELSGLRDVSAAPARVMEFQSEAAQQS